MRICTVYNRVYIWFHAVFERVRVYILFQHRKGFCFGCLSGPPGFTCWISFAPVFSFIYC